MNRLKFLKTMALAPFVASSVAEISAETAAIPSSAEWTGRLTIYSGGNVGIGCINPSIKLIIHHGDGSTSEF